MICVLHVLISVNFSVKFNVLSRGIIWTIYPKCKEISWWQMSYFVYLCVQMTKAHEQCESNEDEVNLLKAYDKSNLCKICHQIFVKTVVTGFE